MKISIKLLSMFSVFCVSLLLGMNANAQSISITPGLTANQMAQMLVGTNVTVTNATYTGAAAASGSFSQATSAFPLTDGIILTSGSANNALGPNNSTGSSVTNGAPGDADLAALVPGFNTFDASVLEFDVTSNCNTLTFDYIFASEEYLEYGCSNFNDVFGFFITGPGFAPNTNIALVPGTTTPVSINNVINSPATNCVSNPTFYVDNAGGVSMQYDGRTVTLVATASIQPCQTYHIKIAVADAGDSALDSAVFLKGGGINCSSSNLIASANVTGVECGALGMIDLSLGSGTGPFTYAWTGPNGFTASSEDLTGLAAGVYTVQVDGSDCLSSGEFTYTVPTNIDVTPPVFVDCPSDLVIEAANAGCTFALNIPTPTVTDNCPNAPVITSSYSPGDEFSVGTTPVTFTATDASGNTSTCTFDVIINAQPLVVSLVPVVFVGGVNIRCYGQNSGSVNSGVTGGCLPYTYDWNINGVPVPNGPASVTGLYAGAVSLTVTDANGASTTESVLLIQNPAVVASAVYAPIQCYGGTTTVTVTASLGTAPYGGLATYTNVGPGTYNYNVADGNGCRDGHLITITQPDLLEVTATPTPILCYGDTSLVSVEATGGTMPYSGVGVFEEVIGTYVYSVTDANGCTDNTTLTINQPGQLNAMISATPILCNGGTSQVTVSVASGSEPYTGTGIFTEYAGTHTYTVYDYNLCSDTVSITITEPEPLTASISSTAVLCNGGSADLTVSAAGGTAPYTGTGTFSETAGTYTYTVTDFNGCTIDVSTTVVEPTQLTASISATSILCYGGTADVTVTAAEGTGPYTGTGTFTVTAGTHDYTVTDANGCSVNVSITVSEPTLLVASATATSILCNGGTADITVSAAGGTPTYTGEGTFPVTAGTYTYTVTDMNGCAADVSLTVTEPTQLTAAISSTAILCNGGTADVTVTAAEGTGPYTGTGTYTVTAGTHDYTVVDANGCSVDISITVTEPTQLLASISSTAILCNGGTADVTVTATEGTGPYTGTGIFTVTAGTHDYTVTDANGCSVVVSITVTEPAALIASATSGVILCNGDLTDVTVTATGGTGPYTGTGNYTGVAAGANTYAVTDANGCTNDVTITIVQPAQVEANITPQNHVIDCIPIPVTLYANPTGGTAPYTYLWSDGSTGTSITVNPNTTSNYSVQITDANGCTEDASSNGTTVTVTDRCGKKNQKVLICHVPSGNPSNAHTICISPNALNPHLSTLWDLHGGDYCGPCQTSSAMVITDNTNLGSNSFIRAAINTNSDAVELSYRLGYDSKVRVEIYDMAGTLVEVIHENNVNEGELYDISVMPTKFTTGVYIYQFITDRETHIDKLQFIK